MDWLALMTFDRNPELFLGLLAGGATLILGLAIALTARADRRLKQLQAREERTIRLYEHFSAPETYVTLTAPVVGVSIKWQLLPEPARRDFRRAVRSAWTGVLDGSRDSVLAFTRSPAPTADPISDHFWTLRPMAGFSEHHALAAYLQFWVMIDALRRARLIDPVLCRVLFSAPFAITLQFIAKLREDVKQNLTASDIEPEWIKATERLEAFFI